MKTILTRAALVAIAALACVCLYAVCTDQPIAEVTSQTWTWLASGSALLAASFSGGPSTRDGNYKNTLALPTAASSTVTDAAGLDTEATTRSDFVALAEILVTAPALNTTILPDTKTMTYNLVASANANLSGATTIASALITQTGAGGAGAAAATQRFRLPSNIGTVGRYVGLSISSGANTTNAGSVSATTELLF